jgi:predicted molibdopterin-dependent oxidoreductase YjgC
MGVHPSLDAGHRLADEPGMDTRAILEAAAAAELDALLLFGADLITDFPDAELAERALDAGVFTVSVQLFATETAVRADVLLPSTAYAEREGTFTNLERRIQKLEPLTPAPGVAREPWRFCASLARTMDQDWGWHSFDDVWADIRAKVPTHAQVDVGKLEATGPTPAPYYESGFEDDPSHSTGVVAGPGGQYPKGHRSGTPFQTGQNWPLSWELRGFEARQRPGIVPVIPEANGQRRAMHDKPDRIGEEEADGFVLYTGRLIYDDGTMVSKSSALHHLARRPYVELNEHDAKEMGLSEGDEAVLSANGSEARLEVRFGDIARGAVFVPYDPPGFNANTLTSSPRVTVERGAGSAGPQNETGENG